MSGTEYARWAALRERWKYNPEHAPADIDLETISCPRVLAVLDLLDLQAYDPLFDNPTAPFVSSRDHQPSVTPHKKSNRAKCRAAGISYQTVKYRMHVYDCTVNEAIALGRSIYRGYGGVERNRERLCQIRALA